MLKHCVPKHPVQKHLQSAFETAESGLKLYGTLRGLYEVGSAAALRGWCGWSVPEDWFLALMLKKQAETRLIDYSMDQSGVESHSLRLVPAVRNESAGVEPGSCRA